MSDIRVSVGRPTVRANSPTVYVNTGAQGPKGEVGPEGPEGPTGPSGASNAQTVWQWCSTPVYDPVMVEPGEVAVNHDSPSAATLVYIHRLVTVMYNEVDWSATIAAVQANDHIYLQYATNAASWHRYRVMSPSYLIGDVWNVPVITVAGSPQGTEPPDHERILVAFETLPPSGPQGPVGPPGPAGPSGVGFLYTQTTPSADWVIVHDLGYFPNVTSMDSAGDEVIGDVRYDSDMQVTLHFSGAFSGTAYLS